MFNLYLIYNVVAPLLSTYLWFYFCRNKNAKNLRLVCTNKNLINDIV